jgi:hypothetical protein
MSSKAEHLATFVVSIPYGAYVGRNPRLTTPDIASDYNSSELHGGVSVFSCSALQELHYTTTD